MDVLAIAACILHGLVCLAVYVAMIAGGLMLARVFRRAERPDPFPGALPAIIWSVSWGAIAAAVLTYHDVTPPTTYAVAALPPAALVVYALLPTHYLPLRRERAYAASVLVLALPGLAFLALVLISFLTFTGLILGPMIAGAALVLAWPLARAAVPPRRNGPPERALWILTLTAALWSYVYISAVNQIVRLSGP